MNTLKLYSKTLSLKSKFARNSFVCSLLILTICYPTGCSFSSETEVLVHRAILHPSARSSTSVSSADKTSSNQNILFQASGWVEPDPFAIRIPSLLDGVVEDLLILEGQLVTKGQIVATLIDEDANLSLQHAVAKFQQSKALEKEISLEVAVLETNMRAAESFYKQRLAIRDEHLDLVRRLNQLPVDAISRVEANQSKIKLEALNQLVLESEFKLEEIRKRQTLLEAKRKTQQTISSAFDIGVKKAELDLNRTMIVSPADGIVLKLLTSPGRRLMSNMDSPDASSVAVLYEKGNLQARIDVPLADAANVFVGQKVEIISSMLPEKVFHGLVTRISGEADFQRNTLEIKVRLLKPDDRLRPEMLCRAKFLAPQLTGDQNVSATALGVLIPQILVPETGKKHHQLFIVSQDGKTAEVVSIEVGDQVVGEHISIISGLHGGEQIIANPPKSLRAGDRIKIANP
jgi:HlyD family secretion protein